MGALSKLFRCSSLLVTNVNRRLHYLVCVDACFTQKRRRKRGPYQDAEYIKPDTIFMAQKDVDAMEKEVEEKRPGDAKGGKQGKEREGTTSTAAEGDGYEAGMKVPTSVLEGCHGSFKAADEKREKASTQFFEDTGLMALVCRHDRVLWFVNMTTPGERQYYALALIKTFMQHIPEDATVGLLYDIGCQLERSCLKWDFLPEYRGRITFAISVFHAYGHQWPCQVVYHPRKREWFGLTDGEGCERVWSSLRRLIAVLRVSGVSSLTI